MGNTKRIMVSEAMPVDKISGKVVDKMLLTRSDEHNGNMLVITFMDGSYLSLTADEDDISGNCEVRNYQLPLPMSFLRGRISVHNHEVHIDDSVHKMMELGVMGLTEEHIDTEIRRLRIEGETDNIKQYNRLMERFGICAKNETLDEKKERLMAATVDGWHPDAPALSKEIVDNVVNALGSAGHDAWSVFPGVCRDVVIQLNSMTHLMMLFVFEDAVTYTYESETRLYRKTFKYSTESLSIMLKNLKDFQVPMEYGKF